MSEKTREVPKLADATYAHTLAIESKVGTIWLMNLVFMSTFNDQSMSSTPLWFSQLLPINNALSKINQAN